MKSFDIVTEIKLTKKSYSGDEVSLTQGFLAVLRRKLTPLEQWYYC